jgi:anti-sigma factor RsiW
MSGQLRQSDFEDLTAWLDGELTGQRAAQVERLVHDDPVWRRAEQELRSLHKAIDGYAAPAPAPGLARRILAGIPMRELTESELESLSAYMDGELQGDSTAEVARSIQADAAWRQTRRDFQDVERLLDYYTAPPVSAELTGRIMSAVRSQQRRRQVLRVVNWLAPAAAAAAIIVVGLAVFGGGNWLSRQQTPGLVGGNLVNIEPELAKSMAFKAVPVDQRPALQEEIIRHLNFFRDYEVVADMDMETLKAIEQLDSENQGI